MRNQSSESSGIAFHIAATAALILAALAVLVLSSKPHPSNRAPRIAGVEAIAGDVRIVPAIPDEQRAVVRDVMSSVLAELYGRAFVTRPLAATPPPSSAGPTTPIDDLFTPDARAALGRNPGVFSVPSGIAVHQGRIRYNGLVTVDNGRGVEAFFNIDFEAFGAPGAQPTTTVRLLQHGTIRLLHTDSGWKVEAFDLHFETGPAPSPSPTP